MKDRKIINGIFLFIELVLYVLIFIVKGYLVNICSFLAIVNPFLYSLSYLKYRDDNSIKFTIIGMFTTVISDLFLVMIVPTYQTIAMIFFSMTQIAYFLRLLSISNKKKLDIILRIIASVLTIVLTIIVLKDKVDALSVISMFYFVNLILNMIYAFINFKVSPLFAIGLILFICCDILIGFDNAIGNYINIKESSFIYKLLELDINLAWVFYVPSQTLIVYSMYYLIHNNQQDASM